MVMRIFQSLGFRLLVPLFLAVGGVLACYAAISFRSTEDHFLRLVRGDVERTSGMIKRATHDAMLTNRKDDVQATISRLAETPDIAAIRIYDKTGRIVMSARAEEIGQRITADTETCRACHQDDRTTKAAILQPGKRAHEELRPDVLRHLSAIETEPGCVASGCHAHTADQKVLGVLDLEMSTAPMAAALAHCQGPFSLGHGDPHVRHPGGRRGLHPPRPADADFAALRRHAADCRKAISTRRVKVSGHDELAELAEAFNRMAEDLAAARREVTEWSQNLERKVAEKTAELQQAQRQVLHMEKMASLGKLSATVAHEINNPLTGMLVYAGLSRRELQEQPLDPAVREEVMRYLSVIERECRRCGGIVQNLLLFARRSGASMAPVDVNDVVRQSLMLVEHHLHMSGLKLKAEFLEGDSPHHGRRRAIAAGPGGPAGQRRRGHERPAGRAGRTGRPRCTARPTRSGSTSATTASAFPATSCRKSSSRSFPPRRPRTASGWGCRWSTASSSGMAAGSTSTRKSAAERHFI